MKKIIIRIISKKLDGLDLIEINNIYSNEVENGDYISIMADSNVMETFPMKVSNVSDLQILNRRDK
ncbi:hypothetical protein GCM10011346_50350 [Oceanobacillus neutriphilus]|uniref:Uncharacterized protein n=2 Tax=Oceanobacillus neutriphilus TaxID=531815 RepID=A0ABQ2P2X6_9BACI|nr:hypothetical protein GCM10011346_50350 [Oceanobacillus neutriphilus]